MILKGDTGCMLLRKAPFGCFTPLGPPFSWFLPKWCAANTKFTKNHYFMNRSVRRHLNKYEKYFLKFFWVSVYTLGGPEMVKKLEFLHFCRILDVFGHFNQYNHEKSTKIKVILKICVIKFRKSTNTPGGNSFSDHHRGSNAKILSKIMPKN